MSIASDTVPIYRQQWANRFVDSCVAVRVTGVSFNETTGQTEQTTTEVYDGVCLVRPAAAREIAFGEALRQEGSYDLYLPHDAAALEEGDQVTVASGLDTLIPVLTVLRGFTDSYVTRRHYECEVVTDD